MIQYEHKMMIWKLSYLILTLIVNSLYDRATKADGWSPSGKGYIQKATLLQPIEF